MGYAFWGTSELVERAQGLGAKGDLWAWGDRDLIEEIQTREKAAV